MIAQILEQTKRQLQLIKSDATSPRYPLWFITPESDKSLVGMGILAKRGLRALQASTRAYISVRQPSRTMRRRSG
jgi:hypothetical protein